MHDLPPPLPTPLLSHSLVPRPFSPSSNTYLRGRMKEETFGGGRGGSPGINRV